MHYYHTFPFRVSFVVLYMMLEIKRERNVFIRKIAKLRFKPEIAVSIVDCKNVWLLECPKLVSECSWSMKLIVH